MMEPTMSAAEMHATITTLRGEIYNALISQFGLDTEKANEIALGTGYAPLDGDIEKIENINSRFREINHLETLLGNL
jgi:hypothetical protein